MRILGIDPGIARTGWGIIEAQRQALKAQSYGCFETSAKEGSPKRLLLIYNFISDLIEKHQPDALAVEELFFNTNAKTAFIVGQARGVVLLAGAIKHVPIFAYTPLQVKTAVTGYGRAEKKQVGWMVKVLLKLKDIPQPDDTADALAVAITHALSSKIGEIRRRHML